jgi:hypothetical protein
VTPSTPRKFVVGSGTATVSGEMAQLEYVSYFTTTQLNSAPSEAALEDRPDTQADGSAFPGGGFGGVADGVDDGQGGE